MRTECVLTVVMLLAWASADRLKTAASPNLFKCVGGRGEVSFQSTPCTGGDRIAWARNVAPEPPRAPASGPSGGARARSSAVSRSRSSSGGAASRASRSAGPSTCDAAKARRADLRERQWRTISFDQLRSLDDEVARACQRH